MAKKYYQIFFISLLCFALNNIATGQELYNKLPVLRAGKDQADYKIGSSLIRGRRTIMPDIEYDTLYVGCMSGTEPFTFYTDMDSIRFNLKAGESYSFYVLLGDTAHARTIINGYDPAYKTLRFSNQTFSHRLSFKYQLDKNNTYSDKLREQYPIDSLIGNAVTDMDKALNILHWVHRQWKHNGDNRPSKWDALTILKEAGEGKEFRCVEYGIVASACLNAIGLPARTLALKTKDVETTQYGAGHVLTEVYLKDIGKWVLLDGQWDAMPVLNGVPLNAVEFQQAIADHYDQLEIKTVAGTTKRSYVQWIYPYLYYFDVNFENRQEINKSNRLLIDGKRALMLVPKGASHPHIFQINNTIHDCIYTHNVADFYRPPQ